MSKKRTPTHSKQIEASLNSSVARTTEHVTASFRSEVSPSLRVRQPVELVPWIPTNNINESFYIHYKIIFGPISVEGASRDYIVRYRSACLEIWVDGLDEVPSGKRHRRVLKRDQVKSRVRMHAEEHGRNEFATKVKARFDFKWVDVDASASASSRRREGAAWDISADAEFVLEEALPNLKWRIGDEELGDLGKRDGYLEGQYLADEDGRAVPLAEFQAVPNAKQKKISAVVRIAERHVNFTRATLSEAEKCVLADEESVVKELLKEKLRSLILMKGMNWRGDFVVAERKMVLTSDLEAGL